MSPISNTETVNNHSIDHNNSEILSNSFPTNISSSNSTSTGPPDLPPRPLDAHMPGQSTYSTPYGNLTYPSSMNGVNNFFSTGGVMGNYASGGMYGQSGYGVYGTSGSPWMRRGFESAGALVQTAVAIAATLEQTLCAAQSSATAITGAAEQMRRLRQALVQAARSLPVFTVLRQLLARAVQAFKRATTKTTCTSPVTQPGAEGAVGGVSERAWSQAADTAARESCQQRIDLLSILKSIWTLALMLGGPIYLWRMFRSFFFGSNMNCKWQDGSSEHYSGVVEHNFQAQSAQELSLVKGQQVIIAPTDQQPNVRGWLLACVDNVKEGLIPSNYVKISGKRNGNNYLTL